MTEFSRHVRLLRADPTRETSPLDSPRLQDPPGAGFRERALIEGNVTRTFCQQEYKKQVECAVAQVGFHSAVPSVLGCASSAVLSLSRALSHPRLAFGPFYQLYLIINKSLIYSSVGRLRFLCALNLSCPPSFSLSPIAIFRDIWCVVRETWFLD